MKDTKTGRPRRYGFQPLEGIPNRDAGYAVSVLRELAERVFDQVCDLPQDGLDFAPTGTNLSIARLVVHLAWAESGWMSRLGGTELPTDFKETLAAGDLANFTQPPSSYGKADALILLCRRVQDEVTLPVARGLTDIDAPISGQTRLATPRDVLMHLAWHWTFHSGHIGLIRFEWGSDYVWTFGAPP